MNGDVGVFARTFPRSSAAEVAQAVAAAGFQVAQFNFSAIGRPTVDPHADPAELSAVTQAFAQRGIAMWGLSATYNTTHPDLQKRTRDTHAAARVIGMSHLLGVRAVTLCTGTRSAQDMWTWHPDNSSPQAWRDLRATLEILIPAAADAGVALGVEPEPANIIADAHHAVRLMHELGNNARHVGIVLDPANLISPSTLARQRQIIDEAFDLLGEHVIGLQAKDMDRRGPAPLGQGEVDWDLIAARTASLRQPVPIIIQDASEQDAARSGAFLRERLVSARAAR